MNDVEQKRLDLEFANIVKKDFLFLMDFEFKEIESLPTIVRYSNGTIELNVYHGRHSYEIGVELIYLEISYSLSEFIRIVNPELAEEYRNPVAYEKEVVVRMLAKVSELTKFYCISALQGDRSIFVILDAQRKLLKEKYALEVKARQLRPKADEAFQLGDYLKASQLYRSIECCLSPAEIKKLSIAELKLRDVEK